MTAATQPQPTIPLGYKQTEVGIIPEDWEVKTLGQLGKFKNGLNKDSLAFGHGTPFVNLMDVFGVNAISSSEGLGLVSCSNSEQETYNLQLGDVLFVRSSVKPSGVGLAAVVESSLPFTVYSGFLIRFRDTVGLHGRFKRYCFASETFRNRLIANSSVSANTNINQENLKRLIMAFPPTLTEQEAIAGALSDADAWIESLEKLIGKKRAIKQGTMQALLTPPGQPGHQRLPGFEGKWEVKRLGEIAVPRTGRVVPSNSHDAFCIELEHIVSGGGRLTNDAGVSGGESLKSVFQPSDVLFGKLRAYLRKFWFADCAGICSTEIWVLAADVACLRPDYLYHLVQTSAFADATNTTYGTHMPRSDWKVVGELRVSLPPLPEQSAIAAVLSDMDAEIDAVEAKLAKARQIKQGMMQELLTGRVRLV